VFDIAAIALACTLGYLDLRFEGTWRADHPRLVAWLDAFAAAVPAFEATRFRA
jgi:glutathione S-transferase